MLRGDFESSIAFVLHLARCNEKEDCIMDTKFCSKPLSHLNELIKCRSENLPHKCSHFAKISAR